MTEQNTTNKLRELIIPKQGFYVAFEGMDGSGKSTTLLEVQNYFFKNYKNVIALATREPNLSDDEGVKIREILLQPDGFKKGIELTHLFTRNRYNHMNFIVKPITANGGLVFGDRSHISTFVYQHMQGIPYMDIVDAHKHIDKYPDLVLSFEVSVKIANYRVNGRSESKEFFDKLDKLKLQHGAYKNVFNVLEDYGMPQHHRIIDATKSIEEVSNKCIEVIIEELALKVSKQ